MALILICMLGAQAQELSFGAKAGVNISTLTDGDPQTDDSEFTSSNTGFFLGGFAEYLAGNGWLALQGELLYSTQGAELEAEGFDTSGNFVTLTENLDLNYIQVPILAKFYLTKGLNLFVGPQFGFLTSAKFEDQDVSDNFESISFSSLAGVGYQLENGFLAELRYAGDITDINKNDDGNFSIEGLRNQVFQIALGYKF